LGLIKKKLKVFFVFVILVKIMKFKYIFLSFLIPILCYWFFTNDRIDDELLQYYINQSDQTPSQIKIMSYNIRSSNLDSGLQSWNYRKNKLSSLIQKYNPDIICTQEGLRDQLFELGGFLPELKMFGFLKDQREDFENLVIFYNETKMNFIKGDYFWLSETPHIEFSKSWDAMFPRLATYAIFEIKATMNKVFIVNCHFDHKGAEARKNSAYSIVDTIKKLAPNEYNTLPIIIMGDFNEAPYTKGYYFFIDEGFLSILENCQQIFQVFKCSFHYYYGKIVENLLVRVGLFFGFKYHSGTFPKFDNYHIDWILTRSGDNTIVKHLVFHMPSDDNDSSGIYASDHFPLFGIVELQNQ